MWTYIYCSQAFFLIANAVLQSKQPVQTSLHNEIEAVFADVIRNISRVNDVLQELINNYDHLQKIYKSQEIVESEDSSDNDIDKVFKSKILTKKPSKNDFQLATRIIWSDIDTDNDNAKKSKHNKGIKTRGRVPYIQSLQDVTEKQKRNETVMTSSSETSSDTTSNETYINKPADYKVAYTDTKKRIQNQNNNQKGKDGNKFASYIELPITKHHKELEVYPFNTDNKVKKRKKHLVSNHYLRQGNVTGTEKAQNSKTYELKDDRNFSVSIRSRFQNKEGIYKMKNHSEQNTRISNGSGKNTALILIRNDMVSQTSASKENSSAENEQEINKELFKTNVLRKAYGDACLKLVMRKCYKACISAFKQSCREYKCNTDFKTYFKQNSKTGCMKEFKIIGNKTYTRQDKTTEITSEGYLEAACSNRFKTEPVLRNGTASVPSKAADGYENVIILRDRFEKACNQISKEKCEAACSYAVTKTCETVECRSGHKNKIKKYCKRQCKVNYGGSSSNRKNSSGSNSSSGSTSGSGSNSGSDSTDNDDSSSMSDSDSSS